jgi:hypothetical protein
MKKDYRKQILIKQAFAIDCLLHALQILSIQIKDLSKHYFYHRKNKLIHYASPILILSILNLQSYTINAQLYTIANYLGIDFDKLVLGYQKRIFHTCKFQKIIFDKSNKRNL